MGNSKDMRFGILDSINKKSISTDSDIISDTNSDITSDTISDVFTIIKKRDKYTDIHSRKTYYVEKELLKKIDKLCVKNNLDKSFVINESLRLFFNEIENMK